jgi:AraC-like DNA-binding protein/ligand-binding sensor protein
VVGGRNSASVHAMFPGGGVKSRLGGEMMKAIITSQDRKLVEALQASALYGSYQEAFRLATGLGLFLRLASTDQIPRVRERSEQNAFCGALNEHQNCEDCQKAHGHLRVMNQGGGATDRCFAEMMETAVPVQCGGRTVGWLWTGQVFVTGEKRRNFTEVGKVLLARGIPAVEVQRLKKLWEATPEVTDEKYRSVAVLLDAFGRQLGDLANRLIVESTPREPEAVTKARRYIRENLRDRLTLEQVSRSAGLSPHHFCKVFRKAVGINLVDYINRSRVELARQMLLKPDARVSEVAFEVGYQSLSQFNRCFRTVTGESPTEYRRRLLKPEALASAG